MIRAFQQGLARSAQYWRMNVVVYCFNLAFAAIFALGFRTVVSGEFEMRDVSTRMLDGFDFTFLSDMRYAQASITSLSGVILWLVIFYAAFSIFISGGIIATIQRNAKFSLSFFFSNAAAYSGKFMKLALVFFALCLVPILIISGFSLIGQSTSHASISETPLMVWTMIGALLAFLFGAYFYLAVEFAKFGIIFEDLKLFQALKRGFEMVSKKLAVVFGVFISFAGLLFFLIVIFNSIVPKAQSGVDVLMMFVVQQVFVFGRVFLRSSLIGSELAIYESMPKPSRIESRQNGQRQSDSAELDSDESSSLLHTSIPLSGAAVMSDSDARPLIGENEFLKQSLNHQANSDSLSSESPLPAEDFRDTAREDSSSQESFSIRTSSDNSSSMDSFSSESSSSSDSSSSDSSSSDSSSGSSSSSE